MEDIFSGCKTDEERKRLLSLTDYAKRTPLHLAATNGHIDMVKFLVKEGADIEEVCVALTPSPLLRVVCYLCV